MGLVAVLLVGLPARAVHAHPAPFSYLDIRIGETAIEGTLLLHDFDVAHDLGVERPGDLLTPDAAAGHRDALAALMDRRLQIRADGRPLAIVWGAVSVVPAREGLSLAWRVDTPRPTTLTIAATIFPYDPIHQTFVTIREGPSLQQQILLDADRVSATYYAGTLQGRLAVARTFVPAGIEHILIGPDHVLFLIGLLLLGGSLWRLAGIVTAFTAGHSVTLALAALDLIAPPARLVEAAIALSIVVVGVDNLLVASVRSQTGADARDIRVWAAAGFGLVHGFGFASVLKGFGLPAGALGWSLASFNAGVEIGQLIVVVLVAAVLERVRRQRPAWTGPLVRIGSAAVILAGSYWFVQRVFGAG